MKKEIYTVPELEVVAVECSDVVTTSTVPGGGGIPLPDDEW